jgi:hypothetical protein
MYICVYVEYVMEENKLYIIIATESNMSRNNSDRKCAM